MTSSLLPKRYTSGAVRQYIERRSRLRGRPFSESPFSPGRRRVRFYVDRMFDDRHLRSRRPARKRAVAVRTEERPHPPPGIGARKVCVDTRVVIEPCGHWHDVVAEADPVRGGLGLDDRQDMTVIILFAHRTLLL